MADDDTLSSDNTISLDDTRMPTMPGETQVERLADGTVLNGRYRIEEILGAGGSGVVYRVADPLHPDRQVALKTISGQSLSRDRLEMFKAEFSTMTKLSHPNVAGVFDFEPIRGSDDFLFTMEYIPGRDIFSATEEADWQRVIELLVQICRALSYMHSRRVIHFDLKPGNVLVDQDGNLKVLDFGIAGARPRSGKSGFVGTPQYMAPEIVIDPSTVDHRYDLYSLGVIVYQLLSRRPPFIASTSVDMLRSHCYDPIVFDRQVVERVPRWLLALVEKLCAKSPADRFRTANVVIEAINQDGRYDYPVETQKTRESYILSSRFVGRDAEFGRLVGFIRDRAAPESARGRPALLVAGLSGVGKSRLMREVRYRAKLDRHTFFEANCYETSTTEYGPLVDLLGYVLHLAESRESGGLRRTFAPVLAQLSPALAPTDFQPPGSPEARDAEAERLYMLERLSDLFVQVAGLAPYAIYVNDLQWARAGTIEFLAYLIRRMVQMQRSGKGVPLAILGSFRDDEVEGRPLAGLLQELESQDQLGIIKLEALGSGQVSSILGSMMGIERLPDEFSRRVAEETDGNPYFVEEVMRVLVENGTVYLEEGEWAASTEIGQLDIPSISEVFLRRASLLSVQPRQLLDLLAVCGQPVSVPIIGRVSGLEPEDLHQGLAVLVRRRMVKRLEEEKIRYQISHDRMRETLYDRLDPAERARTHGTVGQAIESVYAGDLKPHLYRLAHHFGRSEEFDKGLAYNLEAGAKAKRVYENDLGISFFTRALELLKTQGEEQGPRVLKLMENLGDLYYQVGRYPEAEGSYQDVLAASSQQVDRVRLMRKISGISMSKGDVWRSIELLTDTLGLLGENRPKSKPGLVLGILRDLCGHLYHRFFPSLIRKEKDPQERQRLEELFHTYYVLCQSYWKVDPKALVQSTLRVANLVEPLKDGSMSKAYAGLGVVYGVLSFFDTSLEYFARSRAIAEEYHSEFDATRANAYEGVVRFYMAEWDRALELSLAAKQNLFKFGDMFMLSACYITIFNAYYFKGEIKKALDSAVEGYQIMERAGSLVFGRGLQNYLSFSRALLGDARALQGVEECVQASRESRDYLVLATSLMRLGEYHLAAGHIDRSIDILEEARSVRDEHGLRPDYAVYIYPLLGRACLHKLLENGLDQTRRGELLARLGPVIRKSLKLVKRHPNYQSPAELNRGIHAWLAGKKKKAVRAFWRAVQLAEQRGSVLFLAQARFEAGRCLGDPESLQEAIGLFRECGLEMCAQRARVALESST